jgi:hypothetical protein
MFLDLFILSSPISYLFLFLSLQGLVLFIVWSFYLFLFFFALIFLRYFISGESFENAIRKTIKSSFRLYLNILKVLSLIYILLLIIVFVFFKESTETPCTRCNGDGQVDQIDIERLHKEAEWQPGKCGQCQGN